MTPTDAANDIVIVVSLVVLCMMFRHLHAKFSKTMTCSSILEEKRCILDPWMDQVFAEATVSFYVIKGERRPRVHGMSARHSHGRRRSVW